MRGRIYLQDGALEPWQLTQDGRHVLSSDADSWHLLWLDKGKVAGCMRYRVHESDVRYQDLGIAYSTPARCSTWGPRIRAAVERELVQAGEQTIAFGEAGGWALDDHLRGSTAALRMVLATFGLAQLLGDAIVLSTATMRNSSADILCRIGGTPLRVEGQELHPYYDPQYRCEMRLLRFDSRAAHSKYADGLRQQRMQLQTAPVIRAAQALAAHLAA